MLWYQGAQNIELSNHKLKSDTDGRTPNSATIRSNERIAR